MLTDVAIENAVSADSAFIKALAVAVVRPAGGHALLLAADNRGAGWVGLEEAVASGRSFAVEVAHDVFAGDSDEQPAGYFVLATEVKLQKCVANHWRAPRRSKPRRWP